ncbi:MAG: tryptophan synthase subunit alpha [Hyphomonadaceae bacterium]|nr:tryptophan synthase subunit alpha [Hyphomonadaceae bacterium]
MSRLESTFARLKQEGRAGLVAYVMAHDPDAEHCSEILRALPNAGADIIELGFPFTDPMADGPSIQRAGRRALEAGGSLSNTLALVARFREANATTPLILMGYLNPVEQMGYATFAAAARQAGVDGAIIVDAPPEEDREVRTALASEGLPLIRLATPTSDAARLQKITDGAAGFLYYVSLTGVTGARSVAADEVKAAMTRLRRATDLPIAVGFGVREPTAAAAIARVADAVVVGSAIVDEVAAAIDAGKPHEAPARVAAKVRELSEAVRSARIGVEA